MVKKSIPKRIADIVKEYVVLNSEQIAEHITLKDDPRENLEHVRSYIHRALTDDLIKVDRKEGRINYYYVPDYEKIDSLEIRVLKEEWNLSKIAQKNLRGLYDLVINPRKFRRIEENITKEDLELIEAIEEFLMWLQKKEDLRFERKA